MISQNGVIFSMLSILKTLIFFLVADALTGLIYHRPAGENSCFSSNEVFVTQRPLSSLCKQSNTLMDRNMHGH